MNTPQIGASAVNSFPAAEAENTQQKSSSDKPGLFDGVRVEVVTPNAISGGISSPEKPSTPINFLGNSLKSLGAEASKISEGHFATAAKNALTAKGADFYNAAHDANEAALAFQSAADSLEEAEETRIPERKTALIQEASAYEELARAMSERAQAHAASNHGKVQEIDDRLPALMTAVEKFSKY